jgi:hypothetical protein
MEAPVDEVGAIVAKAVMRAAHGCCARGAFVLGSPVAL